MDIEYTSARGLISLELAERQRSMTQGCGATRIDEVVFSRKNYLFIREPIGVI